MNEIKTIGVLTSGGDAPGMNAAIRSVVRCGIGLGLRVMGIKKGYRGLINGEIEEMTLRSVSDMLQRGGTILQTARCKEFTTEAGVKKAAEVARIFGIDALVVIGGDGSFRGALDMSRHGFPVIGIPATIDNDIGCSEYTLGFDTALATAMEAIDKIRDTAGSHDRCNVVEVMGRNAGYIALDVAIATGAEVVLVPEIPFDMAEDVIKPLIDARNRGKKHYIIINAEGIGNSEKIAREVEEKTGIETRATILGHVQRGGSPSVTDRVMASHMGFHAVELLVKGEYNRVVVKKDGKITSMDIEEALATKKPLPDRGIAVAKLLSL
ncbi:MAG: 6-phosphofructokinase [Ruminococcaceae bacterium]|nr:6-phosphofructokinase [Oscillospiraceae bacterium]